MESSESEDPEKKRPDLHSPLSPTMALNSTTSSDNKSAIDICQHALPFVLFHFYDLPKDVRGLFLDRWAFFSSPAWCSSSSTPESKACSATGCSEARVAWS